MTRSNPTRFTPARLAPALAPALLLAMTPLAAAQDGLDEEPVDFEGPSSDWRFSLSLAGETSTASDLDDSNGEVSVTSLRESFSATLSLDQRSSLNLGFSAGQYWYQFDDAQGLVPGAADPLDFAVEYGIQVGYFTAIDDRWRLGLIGSVRSGGETDADFSDTLSYAGGVSASYRVNAELTVGASIFVLVPLEEDGVRIIPIPSINWQIDERWSVGTFANEVRLNYELEDWTIYAKLVGFDTHEFRLDEDHPDLPGGVIREDRIPIGAGIVYAPTPGFSVQGEIGGYVLNDYTAYDNSGNEVGDDAVETPIYFKLALSWNF